MVIVDDLDGRRPRVGVLRGPSGLAATGWVCHCGASPVDQEQTATLDRFLGAPDREPARE
jgi:hypothetical protein